MNNKFKSTFNKVAKVILPKFTGVRVQMMPLDFADLNSVPEFMIQYRELIEKLIDMGGVKEGVGYITIDEKVVEPNTSHRRGGMHVDAGSWGGGGGGGAIWGKNGMLVVSSYSSCKAWNQEFEGEAGDEGDCEHLRSQCGKGTLLEPNTVYWMDGNCVHESLPLKEKVNRQFIRLSMPSKEPWFIGYTENPTGVKPMGIILPQRKFMKVA